MDHYEELRRRLDTNPASAPPSEHFDRILRILFTPEEAEIACYLTFALQPLSKLVQKSGMDRDKLREKLEGMADKVVIISLPGKDGEPRYALLPTIPGIFEFPFMRPDRTPNKEELGRLWHDYHTEVLGNAFASYSTPLTRVVPVQGSLTNTTEVLHYQQVSSIIDDADYIALTECACRHSVNACGKPRHVCLAIGKTAEFLVGRGYAEHIDKERAMQVLLQSEAAGLVHTSTNQQKGSGVICNCCGCCCTLLRGITVLDNPKAIATSAYVVSYAEEECTGCYSCLEDRCQVKAIRECGDVVEVDVGRCIGCGLCVSVCPTGALKMKLRDEIPETPQTGAELMQKALIQSNRLEAFMRLNQE